MFAYVEEDCSIEKCENIHVEYEPSDTIKVQGKRKEIEKYLTQGYYEKEERNGFWILEKTAKVNVTSKNDSCPFDMKDEVIQYYGRKKISEQLVGKFDEDIKTGKKEIWKDNEGTHFIKDIS